MPNITTNASTVMATFRLAFTCRRFAAWEGGKEIKEISSIIGLEGEETRVPRHVLKWNRDQVRKVPFSENVFPLLCLEHRLCIKQLWIELKLRLDPETLSMWDRNRFCHDVWKCSQEEGKWIGNCFLMRKYHRSPSTADSRKFLSKNKPTEHFHSSWGQSRFNKHENVSRRNKSDDLTIILRPLTFRMSQKVFRVVRSSINK